MASLFDKFIFCPKPDYGSRYYIWKEFIEKKALNLSTEINYSLLSRASNNLATGIIEMVVERVLTERRLEQRRLLENSEFLKLINEIPASYRSSEEDLQFKVNCPMILGF